MVARWINAEEAAINMKAGKPKKALKVYNPRPKDNYMKEADTKLRLKSKMWPMKSKRLSK